MNLKESRDKSKETRYKTCTIQHWLIYAIITYYHSWVQNKHQQNLQEFIPTQAGKLKVNITS